MPMPESGIGPIPPSRGGRQIEMPPPTMRHVSPMGHGFMFEQSCVSPVGQLLPVMHCVEPEKPMPPIMKDAQQSEPVGQVSAVHDEDRPMHMLEGSHVAPPPMPPP